MSPGRRLTVALVGLVAAGPGRMVRPGQHVQAGYRLAGARGKQCGRHSRGHRGAARRGGAGRQGVGLRGQDAVVAAGRGEQDVEADRGRGPVPVPAQRRRDVREPGEAAAAAADRLLQGVHRAHAGQSRPWRAPARGRQCPRGLLHRRPLFDRSSSWTCTSETAHSRFGKEGCDRGHRRSAVVSELVWTQPRCVARQPDRSFVAPGRRVRAGRAGESRRWTFRMCCVMRRNRTLNQVTGNCV